MVDLSEARALLANARNEGYLQGYAQGYAQGLAQRHAQERLLETQVLLHVCARKLGRPLDERERETFTTRLNSPGFERVCDLAFDLDGAALSAWLADPDAR